MAPNNQGGWGENNIPSNYAPAVPSLPPMPQPLSDGPPHAATRPPPHPLTAPVAADGGRNEVVLCTNKVLVGSEGDGGRADDDDSTGSSISFTSKYMEEQQHLEATSRLVSVVYTNHCKEQGFRIPCPR